MEKLSTKACLRRADRRLQQTQVTNSGSSAESRELLVVEENDFLNAQKEPFQTHLANRRKVLSCASMERLAASAMRRLRGERTGSMMSRLPSVVMSSSVS